MQKVESRAEDEVLREGGNQGGNQIVVIDQGEVLFRCQKRRQAMAYCLGRDSPTAEICMVVFRWGDVRKTG